MLFDRDAGHHQFMEDVYECQSRNIPGGNWGEASRPWTDVVSFVWLVFSQVFSGSANNDILYRIAEKLR